MVTFPSIFSIALLLCTEIYLNLGSPILTVFYVFTDYDLNGPVRGPVPGSINSDQILKTLSYLGSRSPDFDAGK